MKQLEATTEEQTIFTEQVTEQLRATCREEFLLLHL